MCVCYVLRVYERVSNVLCVCICVGVGEGLGLHHGTRHRSTHRHHEQLPVRQGEDICPSIFISVAHFLPHFTLYCFSLPPLYLLSFVMLLYTPSHSVSVYWSWSSHIHQCDWHRKHT